MKVSEAIEKLTIKRDDALHFQKMYAPGELGWTGNESKAIAYSTAINMLEQLDEPQAEKVEITEKEAIEIEEHKQAGESVYEYLDSITVSSNLDDDRLAKAYLFGYTVKPKRWVVKDRKGECVYELRLAYTDTTMVNTNKTGIDGLVFTNHAKAEAVAVLVEGSVEEV